MRKGGEHKYEYIAVTKQEHIDKPSNLLSSSAHKSQLNGLLVPPLQGMIEADLENQVQNASCMQIKSCYF